MDQIQECMDTDIERLDEKYGNLGKWLHQGLSPKKTMRIKESGTYAKENILRAICRLFNDCI